MWCNSSQEVREKVVSAALANIDDFDVSFASLPEQMTAAANGALLNLNDYDSFDGTHSWLRISHFSARISTLSRER